MDPFVAEFLKQKFGQPSNIQDDVRNPKTGTLDYWQRKDPFAPSTVVPPEYIPPGLPSNFQ